MKRRNYIWIISLVMMLLTASNGMAQSDPMYSQYMLNGLLINPAYAGTHKITDVSLLYRHQWSGITGAPRTNTISIHSRINHSGSAVGLNLVSDRFGPMTQSIANFNYAYKIPFQDGLLSFGLMGQINLIQMDYQGLDVDQDGDPFFSTNEKTTDLSFGAGMFYNTKTFYLGISMPHLQRSNLFSRHWYLHTGKVLQMSPFLKLKPSVLVKYTQGAPLEIDVNATAYWNDKFWLGLSARSFDGIYALAGWQINQQLSMGYAYDLILTEINQFSSGSHEFMLRYRFSFNKSRIITPRYF